MTCDGKFVDPSSGYSVVFDDDGRVAYAYLLNSDGTIVADVWLYNRCETPSKPEWPHRENMPFANPEAYSKDHTAHVNVSDITDVHIEWDTGDSVGARVMIRNQLFAVLAEGTKPGWCCMAKKDGPLAKVLETS